LTSLYSSDGVNWQHEPGELLSPVGGDRVLEACVAPDNGITILPDGRYLLAYLTPIP